MRLVLETPRLRLREMTASDLDFVAAMLSHPEVMRFYPKLYSRDEAAGWLERQIRRYEEHGHGLWLVEERGTGEPIGQVGLSLQDVEGLLEPEIGYLLHRPYWKQGFATEAASAVKEHAFSKLGKPYVISLVRPENAPSQAVARRLGMTVAREALFHGLVHCVFTVSHSSPPARTGEIG